VSVAVTATPTKSPTHWWGIVSLYVGFEVQSGPLILGLIGQVYPGEVCCTSRYDAFSSTYNTTGGLRLNIGFSP